MVVDQRHEDQVDRLFHALADRTRRDIVRRAMDGNHSVSALARSYDMSFAAVQKHISVLEDAGLVEKRPRGRERLVRTNIVTIHEANRLLDEFETLWRGRIDQITDIVTDDDHGGPT